MLDFISENYKKCCSHKNKIYEDLVKAAILTNHDFNQIRNKMNKLCVKYFDKRKEYNKTGASLSTWEQYNRLNELYGHKENANSLYLSNSTIINKEIEKDSNNKILINDIKVKEKSKKTDNNYSKKYKIER